MMLWSWSASQQPHISPNRGMAVQNPFQPKPLPSELSRVHAASSDKILPGPPLPTGTSARHLGNLANGTLVLSSYFVVDAFPPGLYFWRRRAQGQGSFHLANSSWVRRLPLSPRLPHFP